MSKNSRNFYVFLFYGLEILSMIFGKSWNIFLKNIDIWNPKFFINSILYYLFFYFFYFWHFLFNFLYLYMSKKSRNFYVFLFYGLEILSMIFGKSWNIFLKNIDIRNPKFLINSILYYLFFPFFLFLTFSFQFRLSVHVKKF